MKLFECQSCGQALFFENGRCERCERRLGYVPQRESLVALEPDGAEWVEAGESGRRYRFCANADRGVCNWLLEPGSPDRLCAACRHNRTIPDLSSPANLARWRDIEAAKHRLVYTLLKLELPLVTRTEDPREGLAFDFLDDGGPGRPRVMTGHNDEIVTLALAEADDAERERRRQDMGEAYRTLLGHFRHEVGHWYWDRLVRDGPALERFRELFGDERADYEAALRRHYREGPPPDWRERFVSRYASTHPWEDFAETFAHYLHIVDTLETAEAFGLAVRPGIGPGLSAEINADPHRAADIGKLVEAWLPLTFAVNSLNRSMGHVDFYPFVLSPPAIGKLGFVHDLVHARARVAADRDGTAAA